MGKKSKGTPKRRKGAGMRVIPPWPKDLMVKNTAYGKVSIGVRNSMTGGGFYMTHLSRKEVALVAKALLSEVNR